jgi:predicted DNA binding CopG/RHH family protein
MATIRPERVDGNDGKFGIRQEQEDAQLAEFERRDLGEDMRASRARRPLRRRAKPTSIFLDDSLVQKLREKGAKRGLRYQTMLKLVREHLDD